MTRVLVLLFLVACRFHDGTAGSAAGSDAGGDADLDAHVDEEVDPGAPVAAPLSCDEDGMWPALPAVCSDGWCIDAPSPVAHVWAAAMIGDERWFALPTHVLRIVAGVPTLYPAPAAPITTLVGSPYAGVWTFSQSDFRVRRLETGAWRELPSIGYISQLVPFAPDDVWAVTYSQVFHGDGATWQPEQLPAIVANASLGAMAASSSNHVWVAATVYDEPNQQLVYYLLHRDHGVWHAIAVPDPIYGLWSSGPHNVWLATNGHIVHYDGTTFVEQAAIEAQTFAGRSHNDVWGATTGPQANVSHWDGISWTTCARPGVRTIALGAGELWTVSEDQMLARYDGRWANQQRLDGVQVLHPIAGSDEVLAGGVDVMRRRTSAGVWQDEAGFPPVVVYGMQSRAAGDIWAFGVGAAHFDGSTWRDTQPPPGVISSLCQGSGDEAFALDGGAVMHYTGQSWSEETTLFPGDQLLCPAQDDQWIGNGVEKSVGHRVAGRWLRTEGDPWIGRAETFGGVLWSLALDSLMRLDGNDWLHVDLGEVAALVSSTAVSVADLAGTSATDIWLVVDDVATPHQYLVHYDGTRFDRALEQDGFRKVAALAPDDVIVVAARFATDRITAAGTTHLFAGFTSDHAIGYGGGTLHMFSASDGWAISDEAALMHFDGTAWSVVTAAGSGYAQALLAFAPANVWVLLGGTTIARFDGTAWSQSALPLQSGERAVSLWGASPADVWVTTTGARFLHFVNGVASVVAPIAEAPHELGMIHGTSANDVWFSGYLLEANQYLPALYRWNGAFIEHYRTLRRPTAMRRVGSELYATAYDFTWGQEVWQRLGERWIARHDLDPHVVFPSLAPGPFPPWGNDPPVGTGPSYALGTNPYSPFGGGQVIWRRP